MKSKFYLMVIITLFTIVLMACETQISQTTEMTTTVSEITSTQIITSTTATTSGPMLQYDNWFVPSHEIIPKSENITIYTDKILFNFVLKLDYPIDDAQSSVIFLLTDNERHYPIHDFYQVNELDQLYYYQLMIPFEIPYTNYNQLKQIKLNLTLTNQETIEHYIEFNKNIIIGDMDLLHIGISPINNFCENRQSCYSEAGNYEFYLSMSKHIQTKQKLSTNISTMSEVGYNMLKCIESGTFGNNIWTNSATIFFNIDQDETLLQPIIVKYQLKQNQEVIETQYLHSNVFHYLLDVTNEE